MPVLGLVTLKNYFEKDSDLAHVGGVEYLADLVASVITIINAEDYGCTIYDLYRRRTDRAVSGNRAGCL